MLPAYGLYGHIRNNNIKSTVLLLSFVLYVALLWFVCCLLWIGLSTKFEPIIMRLANQHPTFVQTWELILARTFHVTLAYAFIPVGGVLFWFVAAFFSHQAMIRAATGARPIVRLLEFDLYNLVENLSITAGLPMPKVEIIETEALNAYASGLGTENATIAVTRGLLETLTKAELETVLAHELTHIRNRDTRLMVVAIIFVGILGFGAQALGRTVWGRRQGRQPLAATDILLFAVAAVLAGIAYLFGVLAQFALSRTREYLADAGAVELTKRPEALVSALRKISGRDEVPGMPAAFHAMLISSRLESLFSTHPSVEARIAALEKYAGAAEAAAAQPGRRRAPLVAATQADAKPLERDRAIAAHSPLLPQVPFGRRKSSRFAKVTPAR
jgi:heat shock protein HtpX